jgi:TRAP transporter TAXI family solute receptor
VEVTPYSEPAAEVSLHAIRRTIMLRLLRLRRVGLVLLAVLALTLLRPGELPAFHPPALSVASGSVTGAYHAVASAIAKVFNRKQAEHGTRILTARSEGSLANIQAVVAGRAAFGIAQADVLAQAVEGRGPWAGKPQGDLRAVLGLHVEAVTIIARSDRGIESLRDIRGKRVNIGALGSSDQQYGALLLEAAGVPLAEVTLLERPAVLAPDLLRDGEVDAVIYTVGHPNLALIEASAGTQKVRLIPLDAPVIELATACHPVVFPAEIPTSYYPGLETQGSLRTLGVRAVLFTRADMAEETAHRLVRAVLTERDLFRRQHPVLQALTPRDLCGRAPIPFHPGAERACQEWGFLP